VETQAVFKKQRRKKMTEIFKDVDKMMNTLITVFDQGTRCAYPYNLYYTENGTHVLEYALAGFAKEMIKVKIEGNKLVITANDDSKETEKRTYSVHGIAKRNMNAAWAFTGQIDKENIKVKYENGLLTILLPPRKDQIIEVNID
jgi:HSP20 family molecular chaperone IbpA